MMTSISLTLSPRFHDFLLGDCGALMMMMFVALEGMMMIVVISTMAMVAMTIVGVKQSVSQGMLWMVGVEVENDCDGGIDIG